MCGWSSFAEDVVDQREQMCAAAKNVVNKAALFGREIADQAVAQQLGESDDRIQRRSQLVRHVREEFGLHPARALELDVFLLKRALERFEFGHVARRCKHALQISLAIVEGRGVVGDVGERAISRTRGEFIVCDAPLGEHAVDSGFGEVWIREIFLERRADEFIARAPGQRLHLLVDVSNDAARVGRDQGVDVRFDQRARVEMLIAQALIEFLALFFDLFARRVVRADEQIADDVALRIAQRCDRHDSGEACAVFADVCQFIDVFNSA